MSNGQPPTPKDFLQELRTSRRTQGMAVVFLAVLAGMVWMLWPEQPKRRARAVAGAPAPVPGEADPQLKALEKLPDLAKLTKAGELPRDPEMSRDLFLFDSRQAETEVYEVFVPPPPPPTPEVVETKRRQADRDIQAGTRPQGVRYLGFLATRKQGQIGAFMKGEEPLTLPLGDLSFPGWKLVKLDDTGAEFQNLKYPDLRHKIQPSDGAGPQQPGYVRNEF
ncbi:MAG: hypothetical protein HY823_01870 [Acidobacteria bacterium]|nr:hypothetical protein [Acidobacteriota bacterium]